jgi:uncharacterized membrane protein YqiK
VEAIGKRAINEAENILSETVIQAQIKKVLIAALPDIIRESVEPMKQIESIKIMQVEGLGGSNGSHGGSGTDSGQSGSLADQLVNSALRYRGQAPLVDALMQEIGIKGGDINGAVAGLSGTGSGGSSSPAPSVDASA